MPVGLLLIFLLSGMVLAGQMPDRHDQTITSSQIIEDLHHPHNDSSASPAQPASLDLILRQNERLLTDRAVLAAKMENLSATYCNKQKGLVANRSPERSITPSDPDLNRTEPAPRSQMENRLDIKVEGISVQAINTVKGGSAAATSNIIIEPVQIIELSYQAKDKLR